MHRQKDEGFHSEGLAEDPQRVKARQESNSNAKLQNICIPLTSVKAVNRHILIKSLHT